MGTFAPLLYPTIGGNIIVRAAASDDAAAVLAAAKLAFATSDHTLTKFDEFSMTLEQERTFIADLSAHPRQVMAIASYEKNPSGEVLGIAVLKQNTTRRKLRHSVDLGMSVIGPARGQGVGTALLDALVRWATAQPDLQMITLAVYAANTAGLKLYRNLGFVEYGRLPNGLIHDDGTAWEQVQMYRALRMQMCKVKTPPKQRECAPEGSLLQK